MKMLTGALGQTFGKLSQDRITFLFNHFQPTVLLLSVISLKCGVHYGVEIFSFLQFGEAPQVE